MFPKGRPSHALRKMLESVLPSLRITRNTWTNSPSKAGVPLFHPIERKQTQGQSASEGAR
jgi:hypothetical protein